MLKWALVFLASALAAAFFGLGRIGPVTVAQALFVGFLLLAGLALISSAVRSP